MLSIQYSVFCIQKVLKIERVYSSSKSYFVKLILTKIWQAFVKIESFPSPEKILIDKLRKLRGHMPKKLFQLLTLGIFCTVLDGATNLSRADTCESAMSSCLKYHTCDFFTDRTAQLACENGKEWLHVGYKACLQGCNSFAIKEKSLCDGPCVPTSKTKKSKTKK